MAAIKQGGHPWEEHADELDPSYIADGLACHHWEITLVDTDKPGVPLLGINVVYVSIILVYLSGLLGVCQCCCVSVSAVVSLSELLCLCQSCCVSLPVLLCVCQDAVLSDITA